MLNPSDAELTELRKQRPPEFWAARLEVSGCFEPAWLARNGIKRVWDVYVYDDTSRSFLCSTQPAVELHLVDHVWEPLKSDLDDVERDEIDQLVQEAGAYDEPVSYVPEHRIRALEEGVDRIRQDITMSPEDYGTEARERELMETVIEAYRGNPDW